MTATITATPDPTRLRVLLTVTGATAGDTITRNGLPVRYPPLTGPTAVLYDYEAQPGREHTWEVSSGGSVTATLDDTNVGTVLVHPTDPTLSMQVTMRENSDIRWAASGTLHEVMGNRPPLVTHTVRSYHSGRVVWWTPASARDTVVALFADGTPILINPPARCDPPLLYQWVWGDLSAEWVGDDVTGASGVWWTLDYTRTITPAGTVTRPDSVANSWAGVLAESDEPTWTALGTEHSTWADVVATVHPHGATS